MEQSNRYPELDLLRAVAILLMVGYHIGFDLAYFYDWDLAIYSGGWFLLGRSAASLFLLLVGVCFVISWNRTDPKERFVKYMKRTAIILSGATVLSLVTWVFAPDAFIKFGILHLIGVAVPLQALLLPLRKYNVAVGALLIALAAVLPTVTDNVFLMPLGIPYPAFQSLDYYPLLPWFGVILIGTGLGELLYIPKRCLKLRLPTIPRWITVIGKRSLLIYFLHQPILLLLLWILLGKPLQS